MIDIYSWKDLGLSFPLISYGTMGPKNTAHTAQQWIFVTLLAGHDWASPPFLFHLIWYRIHLDMYPCCPILFQTKGWWQESAMVLPKWPASGNGCNMNPPLAWHNVDDSDNSIIILPLPTQSFASFPLFGLATVGELKFKNNQVLLFSPINNTF